MKAKQATGRALGTSGDESAAIALLLLFSFFIGIALTFFFTVSISSFLVSFSSDALPYAYLLSGLSGYLAWFIYRELNARFMFSHVVIAALVFLLFTVALLTLAAGFNSGGWLSFSLLVWVSTFLYLKNACFWGMAGKLFNISQGKRLFAIINSGEVISNIIGFFSIPMLLKVLDTTGMLCISIAGIAASIVVALMIVLKYPALRTGGKTVQQKEPLQQRTGTVKSDRYLMLTLGVAIFPVFVFYFIDYLFLSITRHHFDNVELLASFMGYFLGAISVTELCLRSFVFSRILQHYGFRIGLLLLPLALLVSTLLAILAGSVSDSAYMLFSVMALGKLLERALNNGIHTPAMQIVYQPVPAAERTAFQSKADGISGAIGNVLTGTTLLLLSAAGVADLTVLNYMLLFVLAGWVLMTSPLYAAYKKKLNGALLAGRTQHVSKRMPAKELLTTGLNAEDNATASASAILLKALSTAAAPASIASDPHTRLLPGIPLNDLDTLFSRTSAIGKLHLLEMCFRSGAPEAKEFLLARLDYPDRAVQMAAIHHLYSMGYNTTLQEQHAVSRKITEVTGIIAWLNASLLDLGNDKNTTALIRALRAERKEYFNALYMLLGFTYGYSTVELIRDNLRDRNNVEAYIYALEVAANTFDAGILAIVSPLFEHVSPEKSLEKLNVFFPQQQLSVAERCIDILYKDYARISHWTKVNALRMLGEDLLQGEIKNEVIACAFHASPLLREAAHGLLWKNAPDHGPGIPLPSPGPSTAGNAPMTIYEKVLLLKKTPLFHLCAEHKLVDIAGLFESLRYYTSGKTVTDGKCIIVVSGMLSFYAHDHAAIKAMPFYTFIDEINPVHKAQYFAVEEDCHVLTCSKKDLIPYLFEDPVLVKNLTKYVAERLPHSQ